MHKVLKFILRSSANPQATSATVKFALLGIIPYIMQAAGIACQFGYNCVELSPSLLELIFVSLADATFYILTLVSIVGTIYGATRKFYLTIIGENLAIKD